jgi:uncharacterized protein YdcH (DUF465 family)
MSPEELHHIVIQCLDEMKVRLAESDAHIVRLLHENVQLKQQIKTLKDQIGEQDGRIHRLEDMMTYVRQVIVPDNKHMIDQLYKQRGSSPNTTNNNGH